MSKPITYNINGIASWEDYLLVYMTLIIESILQLCLSCTADEFNFIHILHFIM